jgi:3-dehydroquinate synthase
VIKYGYLGDPTLLSWLETPFWDSPERVIARCISDKRDLVEEDEKDNGNRQLLNLGHTGGHAIEKLSNFAISHGSAVAIGMLLAAKAAVAKGICPPTVATHMEEMLQRYHLPTACPYTAKALATAALSDKKRRGDRITLVLPTALGKSCLFPTPTEEIEDLFAAGGAIK